jgi:hypothetical protein
MLLAVVVELLSLSAEPQASASILGRGATEGGRLWNFFCLSPLYPLALSHTRHLIDPNTIRFGRSSVNEPLLI